MDNSAPANGQSMFTNDEGVAQARRIRELEDMVMRGQRLLTRALEQKAAVVANEQRLLERNTGMWMVLRAVRRSWAFRFLPTHVREDIEGECGRAE